MERLSRLPIVPTGPAVAYVAAFTDFLGLGMILPMLPFFVVEHGDPDQTWLGSILTCQYAGVVLGSVIFGVVSDKFGRRNGVLLSLAGDAIFFAASGLAESNEALLVLRTLAGMCTPISACVAYVAATVTPSDRPKAMARMSASLISGFLAGTIVASLIGSLGFAAVCFVSAGVAVVSVTLIALSPQLPPAGATPTKTTDDDAAPAIGAGADDAASDVEAGSASPNPLTGAGATADGEDSTGAAVTPVDDTTDVEAGVSDAGEVADDGEAADGADKGAGGAGDESEATDAAAAATSGADDDREATGGTSTAAEEDTGPTGGDGADGGREVGVDASELEDVELGTPRATPDAAQSPSRVPMPTAPSSAALLVAANRTARVEPIPIGQLLRSQMVLPLFSGAFMAGFAFSFNVTLAPMISIRRFAYEQVQVGLLYMGCVAVLLVNNLFLYQPMARALGVVNLSPLTFAGTTAMCLVAALSADSSEAVLVVAIIILSVANSILRPTTNVLLARIGTAYAPASVGALMGVSQGLFSVGQAMAPVIAASLYAGFDELAPFMLLAALSAANCAYSTWWRFKVEPGIPEAEQASPGAPAKEGAATDKGTDADASGDALEDA